MALESGDSIGMAHSDSQEMFLSFGVEAIGIKLGTAFHGSLLPLCATPARAVLRELFCVTDVQRGAGMLREDGEVSTQPRVGVETKPPLQPSVPQERDLSSAARRRLQGCSWGRQGAGRGQMVLL